LRWRAAGPTRSHGTPSAGLGLASLRGLPGTGKELGAATGAQARTAGLRGCASLSLASRPRSASPSVRPRCWPWSPRARRTGRLARRCSSPPRPPASTSQGSWPSWELPVAGRQPRSLTASASTSDEPRRPLPLFLGMAADAADQSAASSVPSPWQRRPGIPRFWLLAWPRRRQYAK
jgi:hypothetical protein